MPPIIALTGPPGSGKDECAKALDSIGWHRIAFADPIYEGLLKLNPFIPYDGSFVRLSDWLEGCGNDWVRAKRNNEVRELLQRYGTEAGRDIHGLNCWLNLADQNIKAHAGSPGIVVTDMRFENEWELLDDYAATLVYVDRPGFCVVNGHQSERLYSHFRDIAHRIIYNDGDLARLHNLILDIASEV